MKHDNTSQQEKPWIVVRVNNDKTKSLIAEYDNKSDAEKHAQSLRQLLGWRYLVGRRI